MGKPSAHEGGTALAPSEHTAMLTWAQKVQNKELPLCPTIQNLLPWHLFPMLQKGLKPAQQNDRFHLDNNGTNINESQIKLFSSFVSLSLQTVGTAQRWFHLSQKGC